MRVRIPTPLRSYTQQQSVVEGRGSTVDAVLRDLDERYPGIRFRMVDEQNQVVKIGNDPAEPVPGSDQVRGDALAK